MKNHYVILFLLVSAFSSHAQPTSRIFVNYGLNSHILIGKALDGAGGQDGKGGNIAGLRYFRNISRTLALETGLEYSHYKFSITPAPQSGTERPGRKGNDGNHFGSGLCKFHLCKIHVYQRRTDCGFTGE